MELSDILNKMNQWGKEMAQEELLFASELADRQKKCLTGQDAIDHYNKWMKKNGRPDLKVT